MRSADVLPTGVEQNADGTDGVAGEAHSRDRPAANGRMKTEGRPWVEGGHPLEWENRGPAPDPIDAAVESECGVRLLLRLLDCCVRKPGETANWECRRGEEQRSRRWIKETFSCSYYPASAMKAFSSATTSRSPSSTFAATKSGWGLKPRPKFPCTVKKSTKQFSANISAVRQ